MRFDERIDGIGHIFERRNFEIDSIKNLVAAHVNHLALLIHDFVVLQYVLANLGITSFNSALSTFDGFGNHLVFNRLVIGQRTTHHPAQCPSGK